MVHRLLKVGKRVDLEGWEITETKDGVIMRVPFDPKAPIRKRVYFPIAHVFPKVTAEELKHKKGLAKVWNFMMKRGVPYLPYWTGFRGKNHYKKYMEKHPEKLLGSPAYWDKTFPKQITPTYWKHQYELAKAGK